MNGKEYSGVVNNTPYSISGGLSAGNYSIVVKLAGDGNYTASEDSAVFNVTKVTLADSNVSAVSVVVNVGESALINVTGPVDINGNAIVTVNGVDYAITFNNGNASVSVSDLPVGVYNVTVNYLENSKYNAKVFENISTVTVNKIDPVIIINTQNIVEGTIEYVVIVLPEDIDGTVEIKLGSDVISDYIRNNNVILFNKTIDRTNTYIVSVSLTNDAKYNDNITTSSFVVSKSDDYIINATVRDVVLGENAIVIVKLPESIVDGNITIGGINYTVNDAANGIILDKQSTTGVYSLTITYSGDDNYASKTVIVSYKVIPAASKVEIVIDSSFVVGNDVAFTVITTNSTGAVTVTINGKEYSGVVNNTPYSISGGLSAGNYSIVVKLAGDGNYTASEDIAVFNVTKVTLTDSNVTAVSVVVNVGESALINVTGPVDIMVMLLLLLMVLTMQ